MALSKRQSCAIKPHNPSGWETRHYEPMKPVNNSSETASPQGGVGSIVKRTQPTATPVNTIVVDVDIKGYFDNIPHAPLMRLVKEPIADGKLLDLIESSVKQPIAEDSTPYFVCFSSQA